MPSLFHAEKKEGKKLPTWLLTFLWLTIVFNFSVVIANHWQSIRSWFR